MTDPLDNPVWSALTSIHRGLARGTGDLLRYPADVAPFIAVARPGAVTADALAELVADGERLCMLGPTATLPPGWRLDSLGHILQMVCEARPPGSDAAEIVSLDDHEAAVLELTALVYPHYFRPRTMALGRYFGIFDRGQLAAMIGERMGMPGFREISAVCTHPDFVGRGLARRLLAYLGSDIFASGAMPFLHVSPSNERARLLYEQNGYRVRYEVPFWELASTPRS